jgi:hypothetical protein
MVHEAKVTSIKSLPDTNIGDEEGLSSRYIIKVLFTESERFVILFMRELF